MFKEPNKQELLHTEDEAQDVRAPPLGSSNRTADDIRHELQVLQAELKIQKKKLSQARVLIKESRDRYLDLYDFAPVSYITLTQTGHIAEINFTGATLLGEDRKKILHHRFSSYVVPEDQDQWNKCFALALTSGCNKNCELGNRRRDGTIFDSFLNCKPIKTKDKVLALHITLIDITEEKQTEVARRQFETLIHKLTNREREVLALALSGISNKTISTRLRISQRMVENHRSRIHSKTGIVSLLELAQQAAKGGVKLEEIALPSKSTEI
jgi:PAS domain S-box-containing protein